MNDHLHHLLDGELPDGETAQYLRHLSEDTADRSIFRQQMKLHGALYRNAGFDGMTTGEANEMLGRVETAVRGGGALSPSKGIWRRGAAVAAVIGAVLVGGGLGYMAHDNIAPCAPEITVLPVSPQIQFRVAPPPVAVTEQAPETVASTRSTTPRRSTARRSVRKKSGPQAVTGLPPAKR